MAKTIYTQFDEMVNYDNIVIVGVKPIFEEDENDEGKVSVLLDYEMFGRDVTGTKFSRVMTSFPAKGFMAVTPVGDER